MAKKMTPDALAAAQQKRLELANKIQSFHAEHEANWTAEAEANWNKVNGDYDAVHSSIQEHEQAVAEEASNQQANESRQERLRQIQQNGARFSNQQQQQIQAFGGNPNAQHNSSLSGFLKNITRGQVAVLAFSAWLGGRGDQEAMAACAQMGLDPRAREVVVDLDETGQFLQVQNAVCSGRIDRIQNAQSENIGSSGGFLSGTSFVPRLEVAMLHNSGIMQVADVITTDGGEEMRWPGVDDTANEGRLIGENAAVSTTDLAFNQARWYAHKFTSDFIKCPFELLNNNAVNLESVIPDLCGERLGRIVNRKCTLGVGGIEPNGIVPSSVLGATAAGVAAITFDELIDLEHAINAAIRQDRTRCGYMFNDTTLKLLRKLKDGESRYLWQAGANTGAPDTLNTYRYTINTHMADPATAVKSVLFGRLSNYKVRMVRRIRFKRLEERFADNDQVAFVMFIQCDGNLLNAGDDPVKHLVQA